jgi:hypothetical protein
VGEENVLGCRGDPYRGESIFVHEFAHTLLNLAIEPRDATFRGRLAVAHSDSIVRGLWEKTYAATNVDEYWAEGVQSWFDANLEADPPNGVHNFVNTREELIEYDPVLAGLIAEWFGDNEWRYRYPDKPLIDCEFVWPNTR